MKQVGKFLFDFNKAKTGSWCHTRESGEQTIYLISLQKLAKGELNAYQFVVGPYRLCVAKV